MIAFLYSVAAIEIAALAVALALLTIEALNKRPAR